MADKFTPDQRSKIMSMVRGKNTGPERKVRSMLFRRGLRFRIHRRDLPGAPDIVLPKHRTAVFIHGCFWHGHDCPRGRRPQSNAAFWNAKLDRNIKRDREAAECLIEQGWFVETIWTCRLAEDAEDVVSRLQARAADRLTKPVR